MILNMKTFLDKDFLLSNETSKRLFHEYVNDLPIIDYHCHLPVKQIAQDTRFENLTRVWLNGDHYKWRAMRTNGVDESYITGNKSDWEKFHKWAETVPYTLRNPLYHWTHLELQRYFNINDLLGPRNSKEIYEHCSSLLQTDGFSARGLLQRMNVELICTTDDPVDSLEFHQQLKREDFAVAVFPAFRADKAMDIDDPVLFNAYVKRLEEVSATDISSLEDFLSALNSRHDYFGANGCCISDHGLEQMVSDPFIESEIKLIFENLRMGKKQGTAEKRKFKSAMLLWLAEWDHDKGWVQQFHLGAMRNINSRMMKQMGPDTGWDSIGDFAQASALARFLNKLDSENKLAKTIIYNLNPADNEVMATMTGNFNDGSVAGKIQFGSAWWFLDQKDGMVKQLNALSNMGLLSKFVGMFTDSRSFLSFPRHEYFHRILCQIFGEEIEKGELPSDLPWVGKILQDICYYNARNYFNWPQGSVQSKITGGSSLNRVS